MLKINPEWKQTDGKFKCPICSKKYSKKGIMTHIWRSHEEGKNHNPNIGYETKNRNVWNKGLTKENSDSLKKASITYKNKINNGEIIPYFLGKKHNPETIKKMKNNPNCGGYRKGSGRGKNGWYKGYWCDSTYELCWLIYQLDNDIIPIRNKIGYEYEYNNEKHIYYPDFIINETIYEIKGYETEQDLFKYKSIKKNKLIIIKKEDLLKVFEYVNEKYSKDYKSLYDKVE